MRMKNSIKIIILFLLIGLSVRVYGEGIKGTEEKEDPLVEISFEKTETGWYQEAPEIRIVYKNTILETRYCAVNSKGQRLEGRLSSDEIRGPQDVPGTGEEAGSQDVPGTGEESGPQDVPGTGEESGSQDVPVAGEEAGSQEQADTEGDIQDGEAPSVLLQIPRTFWTEGENRVTVSLYRDGEETPAYTEEIPILLDRTAPSEVSFFVEGECVNDTYYSSKNVKVQIKGNDNISNIKEIIYKINDGEEQRVVGEEAACWIPCGTKATVSAWCVDLAGNKSALFHSGQIVCESDAPEIELRANRGFGTWYADAPSIRATVRDGKKEMDPAAPVSGIRSVTCYVDRRIVAERIYSEQEERTGNDTLSFLIEKESEGGKEIEVLVEARDYAGNSSTFRQVVWVDRTVPTLRTEGVYQGMVTGTALHFGVVASDGNGVGLCQATLWETKPSGERVRKKEAEIGNGFVRCPGSKTDLSWELSVAGEGNYELEILIRDFAGNEKRECLAFVIDQSSPVIRYVNQLNEVHIPYFVWNYGLEEAVLDLTGCTMQVRLDGEIYPLGKRVAREGRHMLEVEAIDEAGNKNIALAYFNIDNTPPVLWWGDVKDGGVYRGTAPFCVWTEKREDVISSLWVNGEKQKISGESSIFQCSITQPGKYLIEVRAEDRAGNQCRGQITFCVEKAETLMEKLLRPVSQPVSGTAPFEIGGEKTKEERTDHSERTVAAILLLGVSGTMAGFCIVFAWECRKNKKKWNSRTADRSRERKKK